MGNVFQLIIEASFLVQLVMLVLLLFSIYSWSIIVSKHKFLKKVISETQRFEERFDGLRVVIDSKFSKAGFDLILRSCSSAICKSYQIM